MLLGVKGAAACTLPLPYFSGSSLDPNAVISAFQQIVQCTVGINDTTAGAATTFANGIVVTGGTISLSAGQGMLVGAAANGAVLAGSGSINDVVLANKNGTDVLDIATGTTTVNVPGTLKQAGNQVFSTAGTGLSSSGASIALAVPVNTTRGGSGADMSGTGGTSQAVLQQGVGVPFTTRQLAVADLTDGSTGSGSIVLTNAPTIVNPVISTLANTPTGKRFLCYDIGNGALYVATAGGAC